MSRWATSAPAASVLSEQTFRSLWRAGTKRSTQQGGKQHLDVVTIAVHCLLGLGMVTAAVPRLTHVAQASFALHEWSSVLLLLGGCGPGGNDGVPGAP